MITDNLCLQRNNEFSKVLKLKDPTMIFFAKHDLGALINVIRTILIEFHSTGRTLHYVNYFFQLWFKVWPSFANCEKQFDKCDEHCIERDHCAVLQGKFLRASQLTFTCSKSIIQTLEKVWNMFKISNKNTRTT